MKNEIDVSSFSWGVTNSGSATRAAALRAAARANIHDMSFTKTVDNASPTLFKLCYQGKHIGTRKTARSQVCWRGHTRISAV